MIVLHPQLWVISQLAKWHEQTHHHQILHLHSMNKVLVFPGEMSVCKYDTGSQGTEKHMKYALPSSVGQWNETKYVSLFGQTNIHPQNPAAKLGWAIHQNSWDSWIFGRCALFPKKKGMTLVHQQLWTPETLTRSKLILPVLPTEAPIPPATAISVLRALQEFQQFFMFFSIFFTFRNPRLKQNKLAGWQLYPIVVQGAVGPPRERVSSCHLLACHQAPAVTPHVQINSNH